MLLILAFLLAAASLQFITIRDKNFVRNARPYYFLGTNFWYGMNLAVDDPERLKRELANLRSLGITNLRIMGSSQGPNAEPYRMVDAVEVDENGGVDERILEGLDALMAGIREMNMTAVIPLNNFWHWSGGFGQYVHWHCDPSPIPYPVKDKPWDSLTKYIKQFYACKPAVEQYKKFYVMLAKRVNTKTKIAYRDDETIMAWQLANEPWPVDLGEKYTEWVEEMIRFIKEVDSNHLVSVGIEGLSSDKKYEKNSKLADYLTCHVWAQNWKWYNPKDPRTYENAKLKAREYIRNHTEIIKRLGKPFVLEEFGLARDNEAYANTSTTIYKDDYYAFIFEIVYNMTKDGLASGVNFWAWAGEGRPVTPGGTWVKGNPWIGDPPHEPQGWYSVYDTDHTLSVIKEYAKKFNEIKANPQKPEPNNYYVLVVIGVVVGAIALVSVVLLVKLIRRKKYAEEMI
eukprot:TRINITY_DN2854_c0_g1_i10.p1 TRINITY_DN2854_c0_g1~~TRINITY_DN2854_c0_g1_i10.p1  ORF type:complete len:456 (+),score=119.77 TRINITY_DN2854_c0_g1_i10:166-1533(+)